MVRVGDNSDGSSGLGRLGEASRRGDIELVKA